MQNSSYTNSPLTRILSLVKSPLYVVFGLLCILALPWLIRSNFIISMLVMALLFAYLSTAWDWIGGFTGQLSIGHSIFLGIGAYSSVIFSTHLQMSPWLAMIFAACLAAAAAFVIFYPIFKATLSGPYFALATMGLAVIFEIIVANTAFLNGNNGLMIPLNEEGLYWLQYYDQSMFYYITLAFLLLALGFTSWLKKSALGYQLAAIRTDVNAAQACGINVTLRQAQLMSISAAFTAVGGVLLAQIITHVDPQVFSVETAVAIMLPAIVGGQRWVFGPLIGALILELINVTLRITIGADIPALNHLFHGLLIVMIVLVMPRGILPKLIRRPG